MAVRAESSLDVFEQRRYVPAPTRRFASVPLGYESPTGKQVLAKNSTTNTSLRFGVSPAIR